MSEQTTRDKIYNGLSSQTIITILLGALEIIFFALMSRLLSPEDFGYFAIIIAVTSVFQCLTEAGLGSAVIQSNNAKRDYISTALGLSVVIGLFFTILLIILAKPLSIALGQGTTIITSLRWMSITLLLCSVNSIGRAMFMRTLNFLTYGWCQLASYLISSLIGVVMAVMGYGVSAIIVSTITNTVLMTLILFVVDGTYPSIRIQRRYVREIVSYGGWLTGSVILRRVTTEIDKIILTQWLPVSSIGAYNRPSNFIARIQEQVIGVFDTVLFPILSSIQKETDRLGETLLRAVSLVSWFATILAACFFVGAELLINIFFGENWLWLTDIFKILSISVIFLSQSRIGDCYFRSLGWMKPYFVIRLIVCIFTIMCVYIGCHYDILGVAISVLVSRIFDTLVKFTYLSLKMSVSPMRLITTAIKSTWITIFITSFYYISTEHLEYNIYIGVILFAVVGMSLLIFTPKLFGQEYYDDVYLVIKSKLCKGRAKSVTIN